MKTILFGSTGMIGQRIGAGLKKRGHAVATPKRDVLDPLSAAQAAQRADALLSAFGPGLSGDVSLVIKAAKALVEEAKKQEPGAWWSSAARDALKLVMEN